MQQDVHSINLEREKWDKYYSSLPLIEAGKAAQKFNDELVEKVWELLPPGSKILEAGCGGGWQSLALANSGSFNISLMDFSQGALSYARRLFEREKLSAEFICADVFTPGEPDFDLVFNAGVLEHYSLEEQAIFLKGMASRSRKYVLALVPNRLCYWYWLWRIQKSGEGEWPYGKEVPLVDLSAAFEAAGLHFLGQTFMGKTWAEGFITNLSGLDQTLRDEILAVHRSPLIPESQKSYLVAALGSVSAEAQTIPHTWGAPLESEEMQKAEINAVLADALALRIGAEKKLAQLQLYIVDKEQAVQTLQSQIAEQQSDVKSLAAHVAEKEQAVQALMTDANTKDQEIIALRSFQAKELETKDRELKEGLTRKDEEWQQKLGSKEQEYIAAIEAKDKELSALRSLHAEDVEARDRKVKELQARNDEEWQQKLLLKEQEYAVTIEARDREHKEVMQRNDEEWQRKLLSKEQELKEVKAHYVARLESKEKELQEALAKTANEWQKSLQIQQVRETARRVLPADSIVLVISKGDDQLLNLEGRYGWHFPQTTGGVYAGYYPANSAEAIAHLESLKARGASYLLLPITAFWWLDHYAEFKQHLDINYRMLAYQEDSCLIYALRGDAADRKYRLEISSNAKPNEVAKSVAPAAPGISHKLESRKADDNGSGKVAASVSASTQAPLHEQRAIVVEDGKPSLGVVLDEFTTACFQPECNLITFRPDNWREILEEYKLDMLFVESAWRGNDGAWQYKIAAYPKPMGEELADLVRYCKAKGIPTAFWNKEDPSHFERFVQKATLFDYVFTSDSNCVARYRKQLRHKRIFPLPFAAQPKIHHPILEKGREHNVCFAGAYYNVDHDERRNDMGYILGPALEYGLHIYDRQHGLAGTLAEQFQFPTKYQPAIKGRLEYDEMVRAYKKYKVFLNVNSVKNSPTMFSRRVFELLACGTPVISAYAKGIEELLGRDVVLITESEEETKQHLERLLTDEDEWTRLSVRGMRKVLEEHTYTNRLNEIRQQLGLSSNHEQSPKITVVASLRTQAHVIQLIETLSRQTYRNFDLLIFLGKGLKKADVESLFNALPDTSVQTFSYRTNATEACAKAIKGDYFWVINFEDFYGPNFLKDCVLATKYAAADVIGKHTHFGSTNGLATFELHYPGNEFRYVKSLAPGSFIVKKGRMTKNELEALLSNRTFNLSKKRLLSIDRFNYLKGVYASEEIGPKALKKLSASVAI